MAAPKYSRLALFRLWWTIQSLRFELWFKHGLTQKKIKTPEIHGL